MGLLDDAIREHLELKRRRGAEPGEIARVEREALEPDIAEEQTPWHGDLDAETDLPIDAFAGEDAGEVGVFDGAPAEDPSAEPDESERGPDFSTVGQETAELDMRTVLDEELDMPVGIAPAGPVAVGPAGGASPPAVSEEGSLEWEMPASPSEPYEAGVEGDAGLEGEPAAGDRGESQERLSFE